DLSPSKQGPMLKDSLIAPIVDAAKQAGIRPAGLLALIEVETSGSPFEADGRTPTFLFERHVFYRELAKRSNAKLATAVARGLATKTSSPKTQYKDQGKSAARLALMERACQVDEECAHRAASWGLGQTMGFLAQEHGYTTAVKMVDAMRDGGIPQ